MRLVLCSSNIVVYVTAARTPTGTFTVCTELAAPGTLHRTDLHQLQHLADLVKEDTVQAGTDRGSVFRCHTVL